MSKKNLSERDICTKYITPAVTAAGWDLHTQIREEVTFTAGRIIVRGKLHSRGKAKRADYVLYHKPMRIEEFTPEKAWWEIRQESEQTWKVSIEQIKANGYNLDIKNPNIVEDELGDPKELLAEYKALLVSVAETREALKNELMDALGGE